MDQPPIPSRIGAYSRPLGPRPLNSGPNRGSVEPKPLSQAKITRKPVGSGLSGPRPQGIQSPPVPPRGSSTAHQVPLPTPRVPSPRHEEYQPPIATVSPYGPAQGPFHANPLLDAHLDSQRVPYPVSPQLQPIYSPGPAKVDQLPYPRSPSPVAPPVNQNSPYNRSQPTINIANMDDVEINEEDFDDIPPDSLFSADSRSTHTIPSLLHPYNNEMKLQLPEIPPMVTVVKQPRFSAEWLSIPEFEACENISLLSCLASWANFLNHSIDAEFSIDGLMNAFAKLFTFNIHTMNWVQAATLAEQALSSLQSQGFVYGTETVTLRPEAPVSGVLTMVSGNGCYSPHLGPYLDAYGCYSSHCGREVKQVRKPTRELSRRGSISLKDGCGIRGLFEPDWHIYWGMPPIAAADVTKAIKRQFAIHELIYTESLYVHDLQVFTDVYGKLADQKNMMARQREFFDAVTGKINVILSHQKVLFAKLKGQQVMKGPHIDSIALIVKEWAVSAKDAYISYASDYLWTDQHLRKELSTSAAVEKWFSEANRDPVLKGKPFQFFFNRVIPRALRYKLLLETIKKNTLDDEQETRYLDEAIDAANAIGIACDEAVDKATKAEELQNINATIVFKSKGIQVDLKLEDKRRKLLKRGRMIRRSGSGIDWLETDVLLLDNFLILAKIREGVNGNSLYITKRPIYLDLLVLDSQDDEPITNFSFLSGFSGAVSAVQNIDGRPRNLDGGDEDQQMAIYPIRFTHLGLGGGSYTLYTATQIEREHWCKSIADAKLAVGASAAARNSQPFWLRHLSDAFGYPDNNHPNNLPVPINSIEMSRCIGQEKPHLVVAKSRANCVAGFGNNYYLVGLDFGMFLSINKGEWLKCLNLPVQSIRVVPEFNFVIILTRGHLVWYRLDEVISRALTDNAKKYDFPQGQKATGQIKIAYFNLAFIKGRLLVLYLDQKRGIAALEPIRAKTDLPPRSSTEAAKRTLGKDISLNTVEFFREAGEVFQSTSGDIIGFTPFMNSIVVQTTKGFEYLSLDTKLSRHIPVNNVIISGTDSALPPSVFGAAMNTFRVSAQHLLLCYHSCCAMCTNDGKLVVPVTKYLCKPESVTYCAPYLIIVSRELVEIRRVDTNAKQKAKLCQVITGKDIRLMGDIEGQVRLALAHPNYSDRQLIIELAHNEFVAIDDSSSLVTL